MLPRILITSLLLLSLPACDAEPDHDLAELGACGADDLDPPHTSGLGLAAPAGARGLDDDISFREMGPPELWAVTTWDGKKISTVQFVSIVIGCLGVADPQWTCSLSAYNPDTAQQNRVGGLGCSAWMSPAYFDCQLKAFKANNAQKLQ